MNNIDKILLFCVVTIWSRAMTSSGLLAGVEITISCDRRDLPIVAYRDHCNNHHQDGIMVTSREAGSWVCPENWGPTPVCQFVRPTLANEQSLTFPLCYIIRGLGTVFCENMVGKIGWVPISRSWGNSQICWSRTHQCSGKEKGWK